MYKFAYILRSRHAFRDLRPTMHIERKKEREREPILSYPLFIPSPASSSFQPESVPWKTSKTVLRIATDLSQPSLHRCCSSCYFFIPLLRTRLYSARLINQRNLPNATGGDNLALCHDPPLYGLFNWHASNQLGVGYRQKKGASQTHVQGTRRCGIRVLDGDTWHERCLPLEEEDTRIYAFDETWRNVMGSENRVVHLEIYGWLVLQCSKETERGLCRRRMQSDFSRIRRLHVRTKQKKILHGKI